MIKQLKFLFSLFFVGVTALSLASCSSDDDDDFGGGDFKFQTLSINGQNFYNCFGGFIYVASTYKQDTSYLWENGHYTEVDAIGFDINLYDEKSIEAEGTATIYFHIPTTAFKNGNTITSEIFDISIGVDSQESWTLDANGRDYTKVGGNVSLKDVKNGKATVSFNNYEIKIDGKTLKINGTATCEEF